jgi:methyl-accepting chemotaxis protein/methyl-accepting chemotaxis protein-1 (serine sensor receptor)
MTVEKKLMICIAGMLAVVLSLAGGGWYANQKLSSELSYATQTAMTRAIVTGELRGNIVAMREKQRGVLLYAYAGDHTHADLSRAEFLEFMRAAKEHLATLRKLSSSEQGKATIDLIAADVDRYAAFSEQVSTLVSANKLAAAVALLRETGVPIGDRLEKENLEHMELQKQQASAAEASGIAESSAARWMAMVVLMLGLVVIGVIMVVVRRITAALRTIASSLSDGASQIAAGSGQVSSASQSLAQGASEQASSLEETSASAEEVTSMTRQNAANTSQVAQLMNTVDHRVNDGNSTLALMITSMKQINDSSGKISKIIKVIDEIAFQTNILALNAAVEAARAGEAGMGFAVVADEVRNLAQRSAQAAKDTATLIEESIATSNEGSIQLQKVADVVGSITEATTKVKVLVDEVNIGSQEQAKGIEEIARSLSEMDKVTQGTAAAAEQSASASEEMSAQAQSLSQIVSELRTMAGSAK